MKTLGLILTLTLFPVVVFSQYRDTNVNKELYPKEYTFEEAKEFEAKGELEKAIWFYINLYPDNNERVVSEVEKLKSKVDDISLFIKKSFAMYGPYTLNEKGELAMNLEVMMKKGKWGDELIAAVSDTPKQKCTYKDCAKFKTGRFKYIGENDGVTITRDSIYHIESNGTKSLKFKIDWINDCEYKLIYIDVNETGDEVLLDKTIYVTIYETTKKSYKFFSEVEGKVNYGEIEKIE